ncbi:MAG TPA: PAS domain S-box protein [Steroidobacteraceae bacterium]|nr:PAS domain S-box protein [Steroidobacteraceae bacterium]
MQSLSTQLARSALDAAPDAMIIIDDAGAIRFANQQVSALFGYPHDELIGKAVEYLIPERFRDRHPSMRLAYIDNVRVRPMGAGLDLFGRRRDGSEFPVEISLSPIDDDGRMLVAAAIRDVTERKRVEAELGAQLEDMRRLRDMSARLVETADLPRMLEEILDTAIALHRADFGNIQLREPGTGVLKIVAHRGFSADFLQHFASVDMNEPSACGRALQSGERSIIEDVAEDPGYLPHRAIAAREGYRAVQSTPIRGRDGTVTGMLSTHFRKPHRPAERELQLTDIYVRLVSQLIARAQDEEAVRAARDLADRANQAKSRFLATASHDLRQPLQTLALLNGTLRRISTHSTAKEALQQQEQAITSMSRLLNTLLDISKLESGAIKPDPTDFTMSTLFEELRQEFADLASNKGLALEVDRCEDSVHSDPSLVGQILRNLLANAIKYTRAGWVVLRCQHNQPSCVRIEVLDTGIGIPAEQLRYIYDEFFQVGVPANITREGYGLGLSIVQRIVTLLEAKLEVESQVGKGSTFALTLPASHTAIRPAAGRGSETTPHATQIAARVLLVEDDPAVLNATRMLLRSEGYQVAVASTVGEALAQARADSRIDLLITDYQLSEGETGTQVITSLRAALDRPLKAVLMTGDTSSAVKELPHDPLLRIVSKPVNADELLAMLQVLLEP